MKGKLLRIGTIILGNVFVAFAVSTLVLENQLISGGVTGLGIVTNHYTGINISLIVGIINVLLFLLGLFFIGKKFALSTLISTFAFPVLLEFFNTNAIFHNYCQDTLLAVVLAGCLVGIGVGIKTIQENFIQTYTTNALQHIEYFDEQLLDLQELLMYTMQSKSILVITNQYEQLSDYNKVSWKKQAKDDLLATYLIIIR